MEIILLKDVKGIGKKGESKKVSDGYASNFLIPKGLAVKKTAESLDNLKKEQAAEAKKQEDLKNQALENKSKLESMVLEYKAKAQADHSMAGSISTKEIEKDLLNKYNIVIDKRKFIDKFPLNEFGYTNLRIELYKGVVATIRIHITEEK
ncbi:MAG: 50S ribosomal protein L9 [Bacilli bacterium]|nr:50S ribosomal protein L9 [Bacilli bacterium]